MTRSTLKFLGIPLVLASLWAPGAFAHDPSNFYQGTDWEASHHTGLHITWRFSPGFPDGGPKKARVVDAFQHWNALNQEMEFEKLADATDGYEGFLCIDMQGYNGIFWLDIGDPALTTTCPHPGTSTLHNFFTRIDSSRNWHSFDDTQVPNDELDLEGFMTHEVGHATGFGGLGDSEHFSESSGHCPAPPDTDRHTMCPSLSAGLAVWRSLENHDKQVFDDWYPDE